MSENHVAGAQAKQAEPRSSTASEQCNCIVETNDLLKQHNAQLLTNLFGPPRSIVSTYKLDDKKRAKPPLVFASFCPFCGTKYPRAEGRS